MAINHLLIVPSVLLLAAVAHGADYDIKLRKPNDAIQALERGERTMLLIVSPSGIGSASIALKKGAWPEKITLRFVYKKTMSDMKDREGAGFKTLEGVSVNVDGKEVRNLKPLDRDGAKEVELPAGIIRDDKSQLTIEWVDAYRT